MEGSFPRHVAIIMDGNGRWAQEKGRNRTYGHVKGSEVVDIVTRKAAKSGVEFLTLYAFSTENWKRPSSEVKFLVSLLNRYLNRKRHLFVEENIRFNIIGDLSRFPLETVELMDELMRETKENNRMVLTLALNYGSRREILRAARLIAEDVACGSLSVDKLDEEVFSRYLYTSGLPDVDLVIRTGGEVRISNFLLWQSYYAELVFFDKYWPDFTEEDFERAIEEFKHRKRRFGGL